MEGIVKYFNEARLFGFITVEGKKGKKHDVFFHFNDGLESQSGNIREKTKPKPGDALVFKLKPGGRGLKAAPWSFKEAAPDINRMTEIIESAKPGDKLELVFSKNEESFREKIQFVIDMNGKAIRFASFALKSLVNAAERGELEARTYVITLLDSFNPKLFIKYFIEPKMLESINIVN